MALLRQALKVRGVEEQPGIAAVRELVVYNFSKRRAAGMDATLAKGLLTKLLVPQRPPSLRFVPTASPPPRGTLVYQGR